MRILVAVRPVASDSTRAVEGMPTQMEPNEWDLNATEEALAIVDEVGGSTVAATVGPAMAESVLRRIVAMGVDEAVRVDSPNTSHMNDVAKAIADLARSTGANLVLCGVQSSDLMYGTTGPTIAALLDWPVATAVISVVRATESHVRVRRELEGGIVQIWEVQLPAVLTIQGSTRTPRYPTFRALKQAERAEITTQPPPLSGGAPHHVIERRIARSERRGVRVEGTAQEVAGQLLSLLAKAGR